MEDFFHRVSYVYPELEKLEDELKQAHNDMIKACDVYSDLIIRVAELEVVAKGCDIKEQLKEVSIQCKIAEKVYDKACYRYEMLDTKKQQYQKH